MKTLTDIIYKYRHKDFSWAEFDCCVFTASVVEEYTGKELPYWKNMLNYTSYRSALKELNMIGCKGIEDLPEKILGNPKLPISEVKTGYPVYYVNEKGEGLLGICNGVRAYFLQHDNGLTTRDVKDCKYCWSID